jgi:hypothetical protein
MRATRETEEYVTPEPTPEEQRRVQLAPEGVGPLFLRDYVLTMEGSRCSPEEVIQRMREDFPSLSPDLLAKFTRPKTDAGPLAVGSTMHVDIKGAGHCGVMVTHLEPRSLTLRTQEGHFEAGRITFAAYPDDQGRIVLHIRSRARIRDPHRYVLYGLGGMYAQATIWITFLKRLAAACGGEGVGNVATSTEEVEDSHLDLGEGDGPTLCLVSSG